MKIYHFTLRADVGGGPEHIRILCEYGGASRRHQVLCPPDKPYLERFRSLGVLGEGLVLPHRALRLSALLRFLLFVLRERETAIFQYHGYGAAVYGAIASALLPHKYLLVLHGAFSNRVGIRGLITDVLLRILSSGGRILCVSRTEFDAFYKRGDLSRKVDLIRNGVEMGSGAKVRKRSGVFKIVSVTRFDFQKNAAELLGVAKELRKKGLVFEWLVLGDSADGARARFSSAIEQEGLVGFVKAIGYVHNPRVVYQDSHVFFSSSRWEGLPLAVIECMSEGVPVVLSRVQGHEDFFERTAPGFFYELGNIMQAAECLEELYENEALRIRMGGSARVLVDKLYSSSSMVGCYEAYYNSIRFSSSACI